MNSNAPGPHDPFLPLKYLVIAAGSHIVTLMKSICRNTQVAHRGAGK